MSAHRYDAMMETIEILADKTVMAELEKSAVDFKAERVYPVHRVASHHP